MDQIDRQLAMEMVTTARIDVLEHLIGILCSKLGIESLDGMSIRDYLQNEKITQLERILIHIEDQNPSAAAYLSNIIDEARGKDSEG